MKKLLLILLVGVVFASCTQNQMAKQWGGSAEVKLPQGRKLITATWKETSLWYLTRKMSASDSAESYSFKEESSFGIVQGEVTLTETK